MGFRVTITELYQYGIHVAEKHATITYYKLQQQNYCGKRAFYVSFLISHSLVSCDKVKANN